GTDNSTLEVSAYTVNDGNAGGNYTVSPHTHSGTITRAGLDISAVGDTKVYDGTTSSAGVPAVSGLQPGDTVTGKVQVFQSKNVLGTDNSTLEVSAYTVNDGNAGGNYTVSPHTHSGTITARPITVTAAAKSRTYGGTVSAAATPTVTTGSIVLGATGNFTEAYQNSMSAPRRCLCRPARSRTATRAPTTRSRLRTARTGR